MILKTMFSTNGSIVGLFQLFSLLVFDGLLLKYDHSTPFHLSHKSHPLLFFYFLRHHQARTEL